MKQNNFFKPSRLALASIFTFITVFFSAQTSSLFFQASGIWLTALNVNQTTNEIYVNYGSQTAQGVKKVNASATDLGDITNESGALLTNDGNGNVYYVPISQANLVKKTETQNNNTTSNLFTSAMPVGGIAFVNDTLYYADTNNNKIYSVQFTNNTASTPVEIFSLASSRPSKLYVQGGYLYAILQGMGVGVGKIIKIDLSDTTAAPTELVTNLSNNSNLAVDTSGKLYYDATDATLNRKVINRRTVSGTINIINDGSNGNINGLDIDTSGNVYFTTYNANNGNPIMAMYQISAASLSTKNVITKTFSLYPNPAKDFVTLSNISKDAEVSLFDMNGKLLYKTKSIGTTLTINTSSYQNGVYLVKVDGQTTKLLITK